MLTGTIWYGTGPVLYGTGRYGTVLVLYGTMFFSLINLPNALAAKLEVGGGGL